MAEETKPADPPAPPAEHRWYVGGSGGGSRFDVDEEAARVDSDIVAGGLFPSSTTTVRDKSDAGLKVFGGYRWSKYFAMELGFISPGEAQLQTQVPGRLYVGRAEVSGWFGDFIAILPLGDKFSVHAKGGPFFWKFEGSLQSTTTNDVLAKNDDGVDFTYGVGLGYEINERFAVRAELERFEFDGNSFDFLSAGMLVRF